MHKANISDAYSLPGHTSVWSFCKSGGKPFNSTTQREDRRVNREFSRKTSETWSLIDGHCPWPKNLLSHFDLLRQPEETPGYLASCSALKATPGIGSLAAVRKTASCASIRDAYGQGFSMNDAHLVRPVPATRPCLELHRNRLDFAVLL